MSGLAALLLPVFAAVLFMISLAPGPSCSQDYYVSPSGRDGNTGTSRLRPWRGLSRVNLARFKPGDRIYLRGAVTFTGGITLNVEGQGTAEKPIVIDSYGTGKANIHCGRAAGITVKGKGGVEIRNVSIVGDGPVYNKECGVRFKSESGSPALEHVRIVNVEVKGFGEAGIAVTGDGPESGYRDVVIQNCTARANGGAGILVRNSSNVLIQRNESYDNGLEGSPGGDGFRMEDSVFGCILQFNCSHDNAGAGFRFGGIPAAETAEPNTLRFCISRNDAGVVTGTPVPLVVNNNLVTLDKDGNRAAGVISILSGAGPLIACNNVFCGPKRTPLVYFAPTPRAKKGRTVFQGNAYFSGDSSFVVNWYGKRFTSLARWRSKTGQEISEGKAVGLNEDPGIEGIKGEPGCGRPTTASAFENYRITAASPLASAGVDLRKLHGIDPGEADFFGNPLPSDGPYSIGIHQSDVAAKKPAL